MTLDPVTLTVSITNHHTARRCRVETSDLQSWESVRMLHFPVLPRPAESEPVLKQDPLTDSLRMWLKVDALVILFSVDK